jgi:hypothetical protein
MAQGNGEPARGDHLRTKAPGHFRSANFWTNCPEKGAWSARTAAGFDDVAVVGQVTQGQPTGCLPDNGFGEPRLINRSPRLLVGSRWNKLDFWATGTTSAIVVGGHDLGSD